MKCHFFTHSGQGSEPYVLHDRRRVADARRLGDGVWVGGALDALTEALEAESESSVDSDDEDDETTVQDTDEEQAPAAPRDRPVRAFHGCARWSARQLDGEVRRGAWHVVPSVALADGVLAQLVFREPPSSVWRSAQSLVQAASAVADAGASCSRGRAPHHVEQPPGHEGPGHGGSVAATLGSGGGGQEEVEVEEAEARPAGV